MTNNEKKQIDELRELGLSYNEIAEKLSISRGTVVSYINRKGKEKPKLLLCKECGKEFMPLDKNRVKKFCCEDCRFKWWKKHKRELKSSTNTKVCLCCGASFMTYPSKDNKYCSRKCYLTKVGAYHGKN